MPNKVTGSGTQPFSTKTARSATANATAASSPAPAAPRTSAAPDVSVISASATSGNRPAYSGQALFQTGKSDPRGGTQDLDKMLNQFAADFKKMSPDQQKALGHRCHGLCLERRHENPIRQSGPLGPSCHGDGSPRQELSGQAGD